MNKAIIISILMSTQIAFSGTFVDIPKYVVTSVSEFIPENDPDMKSKLELAKAKALSDCDRQRVQALDMLLIEANLHVINPTDLCKLDVENSSEMNADRLPVFGKKVSASVAFYFLN